MTIFCRALPLDIASRVFDCYLVEGEVLLLRTALAILTILQPQLERATLSSSVAMLKAVPSDSVTETLLFETIDQFEKRNAPLEKKFLAEMRAQEQQQQKRQGQQDVEVQPSRQKKGAHKTRSSQDASTMLAIEEGCSI